MSQNTGRRWLERRLGRASVGIGSAIVVALLLIAPAAQAQQAAGISGQVRDSSGLALPGATVEASSPALIEKTRAVTTDGEGRYSIVDLRPGVYTVTISLEGFSKVVRDGIELTSGFTAQVSVALSVGALTETITVTGASPVVDTQSMRRQETLNSSQLEALPMSAAPATPGRRRATTPCFTARPARAPTSTASGISTSSTKRRASATSPTAATSRNSRLRPAAWAPSPAPAALR
jgi:hypothetical protein